MVVGLNVQVPVTRPWTIPGPKALAMATAVGSARVRVPALRDILCGKGPKRVRTLTRPIAERVTLRGRGGAITPVVRVSSPVVALLALKGTRMVRVALT